MCYAYNSIALQIKQLEGAFSKLNEDLSQCDRDLSQFYHDVEVKSFNAAEGYYIAKDLQQILHKRRKIKFEQKQISLLISNLKKVECNLKHSEREYSKWHTKWNQVIHTEVM